MANRIPDGSARDRLKYVLDASGLSLHRVWSIATKPLRTDKRPHASPVHVYLFLSGERSGLSVSTWQTLADFFSVDVVWLLHGRGKQPGRRRIRAAVIGRGVEDRAA